MSASSARDIRHVTSPYAGTATNETSANSQLTETSMPRMTTRLNASGQISFETAMTIGEISSA
jgi:hypothetical protein